MPTGSTNLKLSDIRNETGALFSADDSFYDYNAFSWAQGPAPGDASQTFWGAGTKTGVSDDILYDPSFNGAGAGVASNFKFGFFKNYYGYFDQSTYVIDVYIENNIAPGGRGFPPNDAGFDGALKDSTLTSNTLVNLGTASVAENGGTFGPGDQSQPTVFNVNYFYLDFTYQNNGSNAYNIQIDIDSTTQYNASVGAVTPPGTAGPQFDNYTAFNSLPTNTGNGFILEVYFS
jgi:hypothetical protein